MLKTTKFNINVKNRQNSILMLKINKYQKFFHGIP